MGQIFSVQLTERETKKRLLICYENHMKELNRGVVKEVP